MRALLLAFALSAAPAAAQSVTSPDGRIAVTFGTDAARQPTYRVTVAAREIIAPSVLGFEFERYAKLSHDLAVTGVDRRSGEDRYTLPAGKVSAVAERYNEITVRFAETKGDRRRLDVVVRAYDDGVALRYLIPTQPKLTSLRLFNELTQFAFPADYACHGLNLGNFQTSHEGEYDPMWASAIRKHHLYEVPVVCRIGKDGPAFAIAEADVIDWPATYLMGSETGALGLQTRLSARLDEPTIAVKADVGTGLRSPWRVVMIADSAGALIENTLLTSLSAPAAKDFSWVKPGKAAWDWWSGPVLSTVPRAGMNDATIKGFIDFAGEQRLPYTLIDDGWYKNSGSAGSINPGTDPTQPIPAIDLPGLVSYARARNVGLMVWVHWKLLERERDMESILAQYERWGLKGIKVDFMDRDDQEMVGFYHRLAAGTARHKLLLDLHGATHPWGMTRTWPNFMTQEGVLGAEYNKWTRRITARHNVNLAFTRMLVGPLDYTPGGYRNRTPSDFQIKGRAPEVQTTRAAALAMYVVFESPLAMVSDSPDAYRGQPGLDFISAVPTNWDETRFLGGDIGEHVVIARRKGRTWYVGAMTNEAGRSVRVPLAFLGAGKFAARLWQDGATATALAESRRDVDAGDALSLRLAPAGGAAVVLEPQP